MDIDSGESIDLPWGKECLEKIMWQIKGSKCVHKSTGYSMDDGSAVYHVRNSVLLIHNTASGHGDSAAWQGYSRLEIHGTDEEVEGIKSELKSAAEKLDYGWPES